MTVPYGARFHDAELATKVAEAEESRRCHAGKCTRNVRQVIDQYGPSRLRCGYNRAGGTFIVERDVSPGTGVRVSDRPLPFRTRLPLTGKKTSGTSRVTEVETVVMAIRTRAVQAKLRAASATCNSSADKRIEINVRPLQSVFTAIAVFVPRIEERRHRHGPDKRCWSVRWSSSASTPMPAPIVGAESSTRASGWIAFFRTLSDRTDHARAIPRWVDSRAFGE